MVIKWVERDEFMEWLGQSLWRFAGYVWLTLNAMYAGIIVGCWWIGRTDLLVAILPMMVAGSIIVKIITFKERREAKRRRGELLDDGFKLPPPEWLPRRKDGHG